MDLACSHIEKDIGIPPDVDFDMCAPFIIVFIVAQCFLDVFTKQKMKLHCAKETLNSLG